MKRHYIFEDNKQDDIQRLICYLYRFMPAVDTYFHWVQGASNILHTIKSIGNEDEIFVFMDLVPDNPSTAEIYMDIRRIYKKGYNVLVFPIPCAEYFMIKALCNLNIQKTNQELLSLLNEEVYYSSSLLDTLENQRYITSFERYCKIMLKHLDSECGYKSNNEDRIYDRLKGRFYRKDCSMCDGCSMEYTLQRKAEELLHNYPCAPVGAYFTHYTSRPL